MTKIKLTNHSKQRYSERTEIKQINHDAQAAYTRGYKIRHFTGDFAEFLLNRPINYGREQIRVYNGRIYVFNNHNKILITVWNIPEQFSNYKSYLLKKESPCIIRYGDKYVAESTELSEDIAEAILFKTETKARNYINNTKGLDFQKCIIIKM